MSPRQISEIVDPTINLKGISSVYNVKPDGNCGFRAISEHLKRGEDDWKSVKADMLKHLESKMDFYTTIIRLDGVEQLLATLRDTSDNQGDFEKWFSVPDCAMVACNTYDIAISIHSSTEYQLFIPFFHIPISVKPVILQLTSSHFYLVRLKPRYLYKAPQLNPAYLPICKKYGFVDYSLLFY